MAGLSLGVLCTTVVLVVAVGSGYAGRHGGAVGLGSQLLASRSAVVLESPPPVHTCSGGEDTEEVAIAASSASFCLEAWPWVAWR